MYVKVLAKQRSQIIADVLDTTLSHFPEEIESHPFLNRVAQKIEAFFLTDHCESVEDRGEDDTVTSLFITPLKKSYQTAKSNDIVTTTTTTPAAKQNNDKPKDSTTTSSPDSQDSGIVDNAPPTPNLNRNVSSPVVPYTRKTRRSERTRQSDIEELQSTGHRANLLLDDDRSQADLVPSYEAPIPTVTSSIGTYWLGTFIDNNPFIFMGIFAIVLQFLRRAGGMVVTVDLDLLLLVAFASFCLGLHTPRPMVGGVDKPPLKRRGRRRGGGATPTNAAKLLRRSMISTTPRAGSGAAAAAAAGAPLSMRSTGYGSSDDLVMEEMEAEVEEGEDDICVRSPMPRFPEGAELGSVLNCWSDAPASNFNVRGDKYLSDKKKVPSGPFLFSSRGIDLFLTDTCPENVGR